MATPRLGLVVEDKPTELSCMYVALYMYMYMPVVCTCTYTVYVYVHVLSSPKRNVRQLCVCMIIL